MFLLFKMSDQTQGFVPKGAKRTFSSRYYEEYKLGPKTYIWWKPTDPFSPREWFEDAELGLGYTPESIKDVEDKVSAKYKDTPNVYYGGYSRGGGIAEQFGGTGYGAWTARGSSSTSRQKSSNDLPDHNKNLFSRYFHNDFVVPLSHFIEGSHPVSQNNLNRTSSMPSNMAIDNPRKRTRPQGFSYVDYRAKRTLANMPGAYGGDFNQDMKFKKPSKFEKYGHTATHQIHGVQEQADCGWLGARSCVGDHVGYDLGVAFLRYVMSKHYGFTYQNEEDFVDGGLSDNAGSSTSGKINAFLFYSEILEATGPPSRSKDSEYSIVGTTTVNDFGVWFNTNIFKSPNFNSYGDDNTSGRRKLVGYAIQEINYSGIDPPTQYSGTGLQMIDDMYLKVYSSCTLKIQNITEADGTGTGNVLDKHRVDANPLVGKMYKFTTPLPIVNNGLRNRSGINNYDNNYVLAQDPNEDGIVFPQENLNQAFRSPVPMSHFEKCSGSSSIRLKPGEIKTVKLNFNFDGRIRDLMHGFYDGGHPDPHIQDAMGTCVLFALEKVMRTGVNIIAYNWQATYHHGAVVKKVKQPVMPRRTVLAAETTTN